MEIKEMEYGKERRTELLCKDKYKNYNYYVLNLGTLQLHILKYLKKTNYIERVMMKFIKLVAI